MHYFIGIQTVCKIITTRVHHGKEPKVDRVIVICFGGKIIEAVGLVGRPGGCHNFIMVFI